MNRPWIAMTFSSQSDLNCIPTPGRCGHAKDFFDLAEVTDRFHLPAVKAQHESALDRDDLQQPVRSELYSNSWSLRARQGFFRSCRGNRSLSSAGGKGPA